MEQTIPSVPKVAKPKVEKPQPVSQADFNSLAHSVAQLAEMVSKVVNKPEEVKKEIKTIKEVDEATFDDIPVSPKWRKTAEEILGDALDHVEVAYPKNGGILFTVVIKLSHSNAAKDYLERYKTDRRTVELEREEFRGAEGVEKWCKLVRDNLKRPR